VVDQLRRWGYDAFIVGQEHSVIKDLWRHQSPDALIFLHADYESIQQRRGRAWPRWIYDLQTDRLRDARRNATVVINTSRASVHETLAKVARALVRVDLADSSEPGVERRAQRSAD
jgi:hypothetical protein